MSEFVWKDQLKLIIREITRGEQFAIIRDIRALGLFDPTEGETNALEQRERIAELITVRALEAAYLMNGDGDWHKTNALYDMALPLKPEQLGALPMSLANGWVKAALEENGSLVDIVSFPSASVRNLSAGNGSKPAEESSQTSTRKRRMTKTTGN